MARGEGGDTCSTPAGFLQPRAITPGDRTLKQREMRKDLSVCSKLCYAIGGAPYQITGCAIGFFLQIYLLDVAQLDPSSASLILFIGRAWDAVTDPAVGFFISRSKWTKFGRLLPCAQTCSYTVADGLPRNIASMSLCLAIFPSACRNPTRGFETFFHFQVSPLTPYLTALCYPWIVCSTPFAVVSYFLLWYVPDGNVTEVGKIFWYLIFYCMFQTLQTCFHVPYSALTMFISTDQKERDSATAYRMTVEVLGTVLGTAIQGQIVGGADSPCIHKNDINSSISRIDINSTQYNSNTSITQLKRAYMVAAGVIGGVYILCAIILFAGVQEKDEFVVFCTLVDLTLILLQLLFYRFAEYAQRKMNLGVVHDPHNKKAQKPFSFWKGLKLVMSFGPYVKLIIGFLFTSLAFMLLEGNYALYCSYTLGFPNDFQNILLVIMLSATLTIPFWQWFLTRFGKKTAVYVGMSSAVPFLILNVLVRGNLIVAYIVSFASGMSVAAAFLLPWSMLPDVVDDFKLKNPESVGHEAIFYSFYVFFTKFASGVSLGISTLSLDFAGYLTRGCVQPDAVHLTLKMLVAPAPISLIILGLILFKLYPIDEEVRMKNRKALEDLRDNDQHSRANGSELCSVV